MLPPIIHEPEEDKSTHIQQNNLSRYSLILDNTELVKVAKIASVVIALFSFAIAPLLYFAKDGLWQVPLQS